LFGWPLQRRQPCCGSLPLHKVDRTDLTDSGAARRPGGAQAAAARQL